MRIGIASDHRGVKEKNKLINYLEKKGHTVIDFSPENTPTDDYPDFAFTVGKAIASNSVDYGVLVCSTGIGMSIAANKVLGVRCAKLNSTNDAKYARIDNNANCITLPSDLPFFKIKDILDVFLTTDFSTEERHSRRVNKIDDYKD